MKRLRSVSPTSQSPLKHVKTAAAPYLLSILSWNVDNPSPYLTEASRSASHKPITSYMKRTNGSSSTPSKLSVNTSTLSLYDIFAAHDYPAICCLQEVKCLAKDREGIQALKASAMPLRQALDSSSEDEEEPPENNLKPTYTAHFSLCKSNFGAKRFGVGTFVSSRFPYQYSTREVDWDAEGRVLIMTIPKLNLAIVNIYALNGSEFPWKDPLTGQAKGTRNQRKREFNRLLKGEVQKMKDQGLRVVLIGDWNISREKRDCFPRLRTEEPHSQARKEFNESFIPPLDLLDIFREVHGDKRSYSVCQPAYPGSTQLAHYNTG